MEKIKKWIVKFWYVIASIGAGILAILFLSRKNTNDDSIIVSETISDMEHKKDKVVNEIKELDKEQEVIKEEIVKVTKNTKEEIIDSITKEKSDEELVNDFINSQ